MIQARAKAEKIFLLLTAAGEGNKKKFFEIIATGDVDVRNVHYVIFGSSCEKQNGSKSSFSQSTLESQNFGNYLN